jgi:type II secretory pathway pseudopilin PulG
MYRTNFDHTIMTRTNHHNLAMGFVEMLLSIVVIACMLSLLILVSNSLRTETAEQDTRQTLRMLRVSLMQYHQNHANWPKGPTPYALMQMLSDPASRDTMQNISVVMLRNKLPIVRDGFGQEIRYLPPQQDQPSNQPDFVSAGLDGDFGNPNGHSTQSKQAAIDNVYGVDTEKHLR